MILLTTAVIAASTFSKVAPAIAVVASSLTILSIVMTGLYALHKALNRIEGTVSAELNHNGGGSLKDMARDARDGSRAAQVAAEFANGRIDRFEEQLHDIKESLLSSELRTSESIGQIKAKVDDVDHNIRQTRTALALHVEQSARQADKAEKHWAASQEPSQEPPS